VIILELVRNKFDMKSFGNAALSTMVLFRRPPRQVTSLSCSYFRRPRFCLHLGHSPSPTKIPPPVPDFSSTTQMSLPNLYSYFPPSIPLSTSLSMPLGSIDINPMTEILVDAKAENVSRSRDVRPGREPRECATLII
jgi:hypothetical protein